MWFVHLIDMSHMIDVIWIHKLTLEKTVNSVIEQVHISHLLVPFWQDEMGLFPAFLEKIKIKLPSQEKKKREISSGQMEEKEKE